MCSAGAACFLDDESQRVVTRHSPARHWAQGFLEVALRAYLDSFRLATRPPRGVLKTAIDATCCRRSPCPEDFPSLRKSRACA